MEIATFVIKIKMPSEDTKTLELIKIKILIKHGAWLLFMQILNI